jgi:hypothetical protein
LKQTNAPTSQQSLERMRDALCEIACDRKDSLKPLTRREIQTIARRALAEAGYQSFAQMPSGKAKS